MTLCTPGDGIRKKTSLIKSRDTYTSTETSLGLVSNLLHVVKLPQRAQNCEYFVKLRFVRFREIGHREVIEPPSGKKNEFDRKTFAY